MDRSCHRSGRRSGHTLNAERCPIDDHPDARTQPPPYPPLSPYHPSLYQCCVIALAVFTTPILFLSVHTSTHWVIWHRMYPYCTTSRPPRCGWAPVSLFTRPRYSLPSRSHTHCTTPSHVRVYVRAIAARMLIEMNHRCDCPTDAAGVMHTYAPSGVLSCSDFRID